MIPGQVSYATVIHARAKRGETELAEHWLSKMLEAGVEPNIAPWHKLKQSLKTSYNASMKYLPK